MSLLGVDLFNIFIYFVTLRLDIKDASSHLSKNARVVGGQFMTVNVILIQFLTL